MAKVGNKNHKDKCQKYRNSGRREINKEIKQERYRKKMEKLKAKREKRLSNAEEGLNKKKNNKKEQTPPYSNKTELQKWTSIMRKLDNYLEEKEKKNKERRTFTRGKHEDIDYED